MTSIFKPFFFAGVLTIAAILPAKGQSGETSTDAVPLTLEETVQIALANGYAVRTAELDLEESRAQIKEGWGQLMPQIDFSSSYTRNIRSADPFSGSSAGGLFQSLGFLNWLAFNEGARTDDDPTSNPITLAEFLERQAAGLANAGIETQESGNLFAVPNQVVSGISVSQKIFDIAAITGASGASKYLKKLNEAGLERQEQLIVDQTRKAYYGALLAIEQARVVRQSVERTQTTVNETAIRVAQGTAPKFQRLTAEVELVNLQTQLIQVENNVRRALDQVKLVAGIPISQEIRLAGTLDSDNLNDFVSVDINDAVQKAVASRPDLEQARIGVELENIQMKVARGGYFPRLNAFANFNYIGNIPDNRDVTVSDPDDPFSFDVVSNGAFSDAYWDFSVSAGLSLSWNIFNGFQTKARTKQRRIARERASVLEEQLTESVTLEVQAAVRDMNAARLRILSQEKNLANAELNYSYAQSRLQEGVASPLDEREASELLDQSRLSYYQAVHDFLAAESTFKTVLGSSEHVTTTLDTQSATQGDLQ